MAISSAATNLLGALLPEWHLLLQEWSADGRLTAAAQEALLLNGEPQALSDLTNQWAAGEFGTLPPIVLLSSADINGALGAYAISTGTIYLNADWLAGASKEQVFSVLMEELGHHLDGLLNAVDTPGDEGEYFAALLRHDGLTGAKKAELRVVKDNGMINDANRSLRVELAVATSAPSVSISAIANGNTRIGSPTVFRIERTGDISADLTVGYSLYGTDQQGPISTYAISGEINLSAGSSSTTLSISPGFTDWIDYLPINVEIIQSSAYSIVSEKRTATASSSYILERDNQKVLVYTRLGGYYGTTDNDAGNVLDIAFSGKWLPNGVIDADRLRYEIFIDGKQYLSTPFPPVGFVTAEQVAQDFYSKISSDKAYKVALSGATVFVAKATGEQITGSSFSTAAIYGTRDGKTTDKSQNGYWDRYDPPKINIGADINPGLFLPGRLSEGQTLVAAQRIWDPSDLAFYTFNSYSWYKDGILIAKTSGNTYSTDSTGSGNYRVSGTYLRSDSSIANAESLVNILKINNGGGTLTPISYDGLFNEGTTLLAGNVTGDPDGDAVNPNYSYQWYVVISNTGYRIEGANSRSYTVQAATPLNYFGNTVTFRNRGGGDYKVAVTYTDAQSYTTTVNSETLIVNNGNGTPRFITGNGAFQEGVTLTAPGVTGDPDYGAANPDYVYQWFKNGIAIADATAPTYAVPVAGAGTYKVAITYTDAQDFRVTVDSPNQVVNAFVDNGDAVFSISGASTPNAPAIGNTLTASLASPDPDGNGSGSFTYSWQTSSNGTNWSNVGTNSASYTVASADEGKQIQLVVSYLDAHGFNESVTTSAGTVTAFDNGDASFSITGTRAVGQTLTAAIATADPDGNGSGGFTYT
jgi:hypothetical protein